MRGAPPSTYYGQPNTAIYKQSLIIRAEISITINIPIILLPKIAIL